MGIGMDSDSGSTRRYYPRDDPCIRDRAIGQSVHTGGSKSMTKPMMVRPTTAKWDRSMMRAATGITKPCSQHARDAAKLIAGK
jgi:hypothetical protein